MQNLSPKICFPALSKKRMNDTVFNFVIAKTLRVRFESEKKQTKFKLSSNITDNKLTTVQGSLECWQQGQHTEK